MSDFPDQKLDFFLRQKDDGVAKHRRQKFIDVIKQAEGQSASDTADIKIPGIEDYFLEDVGKNTLRVLDSHITTDKFINGPRTSNFLLPDQGDGPDLFFWLTKRDSTDKLLCALQV